MTTTAAWEKPVTDVAGTRQSGRWKFLLGGLLILVAVGYLLISGTLAGAEYFITVEDLSGNPAYVGKPIRISGAVIGDTIVYDSQNLIIEFSIAHIPTEFDDLAQALNRAVNDPTAARLPVRVENQVKPDLLQHEAQAILTGTQGADGVFHATELLLKCPSRFEESAPEVAAASE